MPMVTLLVNVDRYLGYYMIPTAVMANKYFGVLHDSHSRNGRLHHTCMYSVQYVRVLVPTSTIYTVNSSVDNMPWLPY